MTTALPTGTVTFMFTDIEGSTRLVQQLGDGWPRVLESHDAIGRAAVADHDGVVVRTEGDAIFAVFGGAADAVGAAIAMQRGLGEHEWPPEASVRVRIGLHTGDGTPSGADYVGLDVHRAARIAATAHGGQIVVSETTAALIERSIEAEIEDLGKHRLKDLADREAIFQVSAPGLEHRFPPLRTLERVAHNLPLLATSFVGRERELEEALRLLDDARVLTLLGPGGTGKTRLSLQVAAEAADRFRDGTFFVPLAAVADSKLVPSVILSTLGVPASTRSQSPREHLIDLLSTRSTLLVLDNFEHLLDAGDFVAELVRASPESRFLVTSRVPLRIGGEQEMPLAPLAILDGTESVDAASLAEVPAVRLFVERATAVDPSFELTDANAPAVAELVRRLDGLPLAIELVVAQLRLLPVEAVLERLDTSRLGGGARDAPERHQTLWNAISWSVESLAPGDRRLLGHLSVFSGGARIEEIERVCGVVDLDVDLLGGLGNLVESSLLVRGDSEHHVRFRVLRVIREYAHQLLEEMGEAGQYAAAHAAAYADLAEEAFAEILTKERPMWLEVLDLDHDNVRSALEWAIESREADLAFRLASSMWRFWQTRGHIHEARRFLERVLALDGGSDRLRAKAIEAAGGISWWQGDLDQADVYYVQALEMQREFGDPSEIANALYNRALTLAYGAADAAQSEALLDEAEALYTELDDPGGLANIYWGRGSMGFMELASADESAPVLEKAIAEYNRAGNVFGEAWANFELAALLAKVDQLDRAERLLERGLRLLKDSRDYSAAVMFVAVFGGVALKRGDMDRAVRLAGAAFGLRDLSGVDLISIEVNQFEGLTKEDMELLEGDLAVAHQEGLAMGYDQAVAYALREGSD